MKTIGTEKESGLHRALKFRYAGPEGTTETTRGGYVCDCVTGEGEIIEVQTGSFGPLKAKARELAAGGILRIVHPIIVNKYIELYDEGGSLIRSRKSPRHGSPWDLFKALIYAPELPALRNIRIELAPVDIREWRVRDGRGSWRRGGARIAGKNPTAFYPPIVLGETGDYRRFLPFTGKEEFTARLLADRAGINPVLARKTLYVLLKLNLVERIGRKGPAWIYRLKRRRRL